MQKKYFKCYFCKIGNSHTVPIEQKGKECRCCQAYNYFYNNNNTQNNNNQNKNNNIKKNNNNKYHINNDTYHNNQNHNNKNYNKKYFKKKKANNNYENNNNNSFRNENNRRTNNQISYLDNLINRIFSNDNLNLNYNNDQRSVININRNNFIYLNSHNNNVEEEKKNIKYSWLKLEKLSEELKSKKQDDYECTICLNIIELNQDIHILKCGHIFHYKCIESLIDHHLNCCPNCRCDIKTGKKQENHQINENNEYDFFPYISQLFFDDGNEDLFDH